MENEKLKLRARVTDEMIEQHGTLGIAELEEFARVSKELEPYRCLGCYEIVYSTEDYVIRHGVRTHKNCNDEIEKQAKEARQRLEKQKEDYAQFKRDVEQGKKPISSTLTITVHGLKPDIDRFDTELEQIARDYNLKPWTKIHAQRRKTK